MSSSKLDALEVKIKVSKLDKVEKLIRDGLHTDGGHHKQWYLEQIAETLNIDLSNEEQWDEGVAP